MTSNSVFNAAGTAFDRAGAGYFDWLDHIWPAAGCSHPVRLAGELRVIDPATGELLRTATTDDMPDGLIYKACGNRRSTVCPSCAETYRRDAYHVIRSGLTGGKGIPQHVATHPAVFATFTAPSFGVVHTRVIRHHTCASRTRCTCRAEPCHARRDATACEHGQPGVCFTRHHTGDPLLGQPLCPDCYDYRAHVVWNNSAGELWRRTKQAIERRLNQLIRARYAPGPPPHRYPRVRVSHGKAAEYQVRGAVHFHALLRLDGIDPGDPDALIPPPARITAADLDDATRHAAAVIRYRTGPHTDSADGWLNAWGSEIDVRTVSLHGDAVTDSMVAGYLAKYATKGTEITGHNSGRIDGDTIDLYAAADGNHTERLIHTCWALGDHPDYRSLRRWAHMLGFGGHFLTKGHHYSITFADIRTARIYYRRTQDNGTEHGPIRTADHVQEETTLIIGNLYYAGTGWKTTGDALLANTAADQARRRREAGREDLAHEQGSAADSADLAA